MAPGGCYYVLRKAGLLEHREGRVELSPEHLSADRERFQYETRVFHLDADQAEWVCYGPPE